MTEVQFDIQMDRIRQCFGATAYNTYRVGMIWRAVQDLPYESFEKICDFLMHTMRKAPLPSDFFSAASSERRSLPRERIVQEIAAVCADCFDTGCVRVQQADEGIDALALCLCGRGSGSDWKLPRLSVKMRMAMAVTAPPIEWFKPTIDQPNEKRVYRQIEKLEIAWRARINKSIKFWGDWAQIFLDAGPTHHMSDR